MMQIVLKYSSNSYWRSAWIKLLVTKPEEKGGTGGGSGTREMLGYPLPAGTLLPASHRRRSRHWSPSRPVWHLPAAARHVPAIPEFPPAKKWVPGWGDAGQGWRGKPRWCCFFKAMDGET